MGLKGQIHRAGLFAEKAVYAGLDAARLLVPLGRLLPTGPTVLSFHSVQPAFDFGNRRFVVSHPLEDFEAAVAYLHKHFQVVPLSWIADHVEGRRSLGKRHVALTFDDGYRDNLTFVHPILLKYGFPWTVFLTAGPMEAGEPLWTVRLADMVFQARNGLYEAALSGRGGPRRFALDLGSEEKKLAALSSLSGFLVTQDRDQVYENLEALAGVLSYSGLSADAERLSVLFWDEARTLADSGVELGSHGLWHLSMEPQAGAALKEEIEGSRAQIEERTGRTVSFFGYPFGTPGHFGPRSRAALEEAGFRAAFLNFRGPVVAGGDRFAIKRLSCPVNDPIRMKGWLAGFANFLYLPGLSMDIRPEAPETGNKDL